MSELKLQPCPYCGSHSVGDTGFWRHVISCHTCGASTAPYSHYHDTVDAWNARSLTPQQLHADELLEALGYVLNQLRLAYMGFNNTSIDANRLQVLYNTVAGEDL